MVLKSKIGNQRILSQRIINLSFQRDGQNVDHTIDGSATPASGYQRFFWGLRTKFFPSNLEVIEQRQINFLN
jgi:hypothetical protein